MPPGSDPPRGQSRSQQGDTPDLGADCTETHFEMLLQVPCQLANGTSPAQPRRGRVAPQPSHPLLQGVHPTPAATCTTWHVKEGRDPAPRGRQRRGCSSALCQQNPHLQIPLATPPPSHMHHPPGLHFWRSARAAAVSYFSVVDDLNSFPALRGRQ